MKIAPVLIALSMLISLTSMAVASVSLVKVNECSGEFNPTPSDPPVCTGGTGTR